MRGAYKLHRRRLGFSLRKMGDKIFERAFLQCYYAGHMGCDLYADGVRNSCAAGKAMGHTREDIRMHDGGAACGQSGSH